MPLIILCGYPSSGKTKRCKQLETYFKGQGKEVIVVNELHEIRKATFEKDSFYNDSRKEKHIRGLLKSEVHKVISPTNVVILDGPNYIKGYRYELYCGSKANHSTQCTIYTLINQSDAWNFNVNRAEKDEVYERGTFDGLIMRFEEPDGRNRWDSPLFTIMSEQEIDFKAVSDSLFEKKAPPPNMSTQNAPLSSTNFLYDMNRVTKEITTTIVTLIKSGATGVTPVPAHPNLKIDLSNATVPKLISLNRQYLTYSKMNTPDLKDVPQLYIQYLKSNLL